MAARGDAALGGYSAPLPDIPVAVAQPQTGKQEAVYSSFPQTGHVLSTTRGGSDPPCTSGPPLHANFLQLQMSHTLIWSRAYWRSLRPGLTTTSDK